MGARVLLYMVLLYAGCTSRGRYVILGNIEEPQHIIADTISSILNRYLDDTVLLMEGMGNQHNFNRLMAGEAHFAVVDNYTTTEAGVQVVLPLYPQVLHVVHKGYYHPRTLKELLEGKKVFAGLEGSGAWKFVQRLLQDYGIHANQIEFVSVYEIFDADVIFSFTDLLRYEELRDLEGYSLFSFDTPEMLGRGALVDGICLRYPEFEPFILPRELYGSYTTTPVLTVKMEALLVCRSDLPVDFVYETCSILTDQKHRLAGINPLLAGFGDDFSPNELNMVLHQGSRNFLERYQPGFLERYAEVLSVLISIVIALGSGLITLRQWRRSIKKNKIDVFYKSIMLLIDEIPHIQTLTEAERITVELNALQKTTIELVIQEKLSADESFIIFLKLCKQALDDLHFHTARFASNPAVPQSTKVVHTLKD